MKAKRIFGFDFVKAIATISIVLTHYNALFIYNFPDRSDLMIFGSQISNIYLGSWAVSLFFILSGASLMYVYGRGKFKIGLFYKKRFFNIYPMFWIAYLFAFLYLFWINGNIPFMDVPKINLLLTLVGFDGCFSLIMPTFYILGEWFLGCIIALYIVFPIMRWLINKHPYIGIIVLIIVFCCMEFIYDGKLYRNCIFLTRLPEFCFGMYFVKYIKFFKKRLYILSLLSIAIFVCNWILAPSIPDDIQVLYVGVSSFIFLMCISKIFKKFNLITCISNFISKYSYAIFLVHHVVIIQLAMHFDILSFRITSSIVLFVLCFVVTLILSVLLYNFEKMIMLNIRRGVKLVSNNAKENKIEE